MIQSGIAFDTMDMRLDATDLQRRFPDMELTSVADVVRTRFNKDAFPVSPRAVSPDPAG